MYLDTPPKRIETEIYASMPEQYRRAGMHTAWADANKGGEAIDSFIEGPAFDAHGNLYIVDIPHGRIFRIAPDRSWTLVADYDGWPNGLKIDGQGRIVIADYRQGIVQLDPVSGSVTPLAGHRYSESFRGCNDLHIAANGDIYFTDQGQTGLHDPTGRVYRLRPGGELDCLIATGPSPNGLVLDASERVLFVAMTRDNSIWRLPLMRDGMVSKAGRFCSMFGASGPDGLTMDNQGRLFAAHASLGSVFVFASNGECIARIQSCAGPTCTNVALGGENRRQLFITESSTGSVLVASLDGL